MNTSSTAETEARILARVIAPGDPTLHPSVAHEFLTWGFTAGDQERMAELAAKARGRGLTEAEKTEMEAYERVSSFLGMIQSKARRSLRGVMNDRSRPLGVNHGMEESS
jgi:hypothetical protein